MTKQQLREKIYELADSFLVEAKDQYGKERSLERLNTDRHLFVDNCLHLIDEYAEALKLKANTKLITDDEAGYNVIWVAKVYNAAYHEHDFDLNSKKCKCGIEKIFMIEAEDDIAEQRRRAGIGEK